MNREPLVTVASLTALATALIAVLVSFGLPLSKDQEAAILGLVAVAAPFVVAALARPKVTPVAGPGGGDHLERGAVDTGLVVLVAILVVVLLIFFGVNGR